MTWVVAGFVILLVIDCFDSWVSRRLVKAQREAIKLEIRGCRVGCYCARYRKPCPEHEAFIDGLWAAQAIYDRTGSRR